MTAKFAPLIEDLLALRTLVFFADYFEDLDAGQHLLPSFLTQLSGVFLEGALGKGEPEQ